MKLSILWIVSFVSLFCCKPKKSDADRQVTKRTITYKTIGDNNLELHFFTTGRKEKKAVIVFFHPGGWFSGNPDFFSQQAKEFSLLGYHAISVEYRLADFKTTTPADCLKDVIDALKYLNQNKEKLNLDLAELFLIGYSAGGHLAIMSQLGEDTSMSLAKKVFAIATPVSLVENELLKDAPMTTEDKIKISPIYHIQNLKTKLYLFSGTDDEYVKYSSIMLFTDKANQLNKNVELITFKNAGHFLLTGYKEKIVKKIEQEILGK